MPKPGIHPSYGPTQVHCSCGNTFETRSTHKGKISLEICSNCHPFFTGKQKLVDTAGRIEPHLAGRPLEHIRIVQALAVTELGAHRVALAVTPEVNQDLAGADKEVAEAQAHVADPGGRRAGRIALVSTREAAREAT